MRTPVDPSLFRREPFSGNPPFSPKIFGFVVRLRVPGAFGSPRQRLATSEERAWFHAHGYKFFGGKWCRPDRRAARSAQPSWDWESWRAERGQRISP